MANGGLTSFVRPLPRILENNARYLLFQYTWEEEWSRLAGVRYMLLWTLQICLLTSQQQLTQMTTLSSTGSTSLASWRLTDVLLPFWIFLLKVTCNLLFFFLFFECRCSWGFCPWNPSHFLYSLWKIFSISWPIRDQIFSWASDSYSTHMYYLLG